MKMLIHTFKLLGYDLKSNEKQWCHFVGKDFEITVNFSIIFIDYYYHFNFKSVKNKFNGSFSAYLRNAEDYKTLMNLIVTNK